MNADQHAKRRHEAPEVAAAAHRMMRGLVKRAAEGDTQALEGLLGLEAKLTEAITAAGQGLHDFGYSYGELAQVAGISRQGARQRFTRRETANERQSRLAAQEAAAYEALTTGEAI